MARFFHELSDLEKMSLIDISYSRISSYEMCPAKYFYSYIAQEEQIFSAPATLGNIVHSVLEEHLGEDDLNLAEMGTIFESHRMESDPDGEIGFDLIAAAYQMMAEFVDRHDDEEFDIIAKELPFELVIGSMLVRGFMDRVDKESDGIRIVDYKTGKFEESQKNIATNLQLRIYALAASYLYPDVNVFHTELYYLRSGRRKGHVFRREDMPELEADILEKLGVILNDFYFHETQTKEYVCSFCEHATTGVCKVGVMRRKSRRRR